MRLFIAFPAPPLTAFFPLPLKDATRVETDDLHLTLSFIGDVPHNIGYDIMDELTRVVFTLFEITLTSYGVFGGEKPRGLHLVAQKSPALMQFQQKIEQLLRKLGLPLESRDFIPHVTLAHVALAHVKNNTKGEVLAFIAAQPLFAPIHFMPLCFNLYESKGLLDNTPYAIVSSHASRLTTPSC